MNAILQHPSAQHPDITIIDRAKLRNEVIYIVFDLKRAFGVFDWS